MGIFLILVLLKTPGNWTCTPKRFFYLLEFLCILREEGTVILILGTTLGDNGQLDNFHRRITGATVVQLEPR